MPAFFLPSLSSFAHFHAPSIAIPRSYSLKKEQNCGRIPPVRVSVALLWWKDVATERPMNNEAHAALAASHRGRRDMREEEGLGWRVSWHQWGRHQETCRRWWLKCEFHKTTKNERGSLRVKQQHLRSALRCYLLEPEGEPAIVPEREYKKREEMRVYLCICLKTWLCLIHPTQVAERSQQLLCKTRVTPLLL